MRRREFITFLSGAAIAWPLAARGQQERKLATIGLLGSGTAAAQSQWTAAFLGRMRELGWIEGRNLTIQYRWAEGHNERLRELARELVQLKVDLIVTHNTPPPLAAKQATSTIPIVFATAGDPVGTGIVASLGRPGGNVTGLSSQTPETASKRLELLRAIVPNLRRLAILSDMDNLFVKLDLSQMRKAAANLGIEIATFQITRGEVFPRVSKRSRGIARHCMSHQFRSHSSIALALIPWRSRLACRHCTVCGSTSKPEV
jgi:putative ABC transport system substrate-binding protein